MVDGINGTSAYLSCRVLANPARKSGVPAPVLRLTTQPLALEVEVDEPMTMVGGTVSVSERRSDLFNKNNVFGVINRSSEGGRVIW